MSLISVSMDRLSMNFIVLAHAARRSRQGERHAFLIQRLFEHDAVSLYMNPVAYASAPRRETPIATLIALPVKENVLLFDEVDLPDVELIELDGDVDAWTDADR